MALPPAPRFRTGQGFQHRYRREVLDHFAMPGPNGSADYQNLTRSWIELRDEAKLSILNAIAHQANTLWRKTWSLSEPASKALPTRGMDSQSACSR